MLQKVKNSEVYLAESSHDIETLKFTKMNLVTKFFKKKNRR